jgi:hypothetical protein
MVATNARAQSEHIIISYSPDEDDGSMQNTHLGNLNILAQNRKKEYLTCDMPWSTDHEVQMNFLWPH